MQSLITVHFHRGYIPGLYWVSRFFLHTQRGIHVGELHLLNETNEKSRTIQN